MTMRKHVPSGCFSMCTSDEGDSSVGLGGGGFMIGGFVDGVGCGGGGGFMITGVVDDVVGSVVTVVVGAGGLGCGSGGFGPVLPLPSSC